MAHKFAYWQWVKDTFVTKAEVDIHNLDVSNVSDRLADAEDKTGQALREVGSRVSLAEYQARIASLQQDLDDAEASLNQATSDLSAAQQLINSAFDQIELKSDQAYVDAAKQQAIDAAAIDAQARAEAAAQQIQDNLEQAELDLQSAITSGDQNAIAQAQIKADAARQAAIDAAAADATAKADAARQAAITAAASDATAKAAEAMNKANAALTAAQSAQATADNAIRTYYAENPPWPNGSSQPDDVLGDMWYKNSTGQAYRWNGTTWSVIVDQTIGQALAAAQTAQTTADGKITAFYQPSEPLEGEEGDLWFDTDDGNKLYRRAGSSWVSVADARLAMQAGAITALQSDLAGVAGRTDGKANIYYQNTPPANMTSADKGDVWIDTTSGRVVKVWSGAAWVEADSRTASTLASVNTKITTYYQNDAPPTTGRTTGDLWVDSDDQTVWRWSGSAWVKAMDPASLADAARQAAIQAAAADATAKAEQAEADAAAAAAADATTKANAAKAAAEQAAQIYADQVAAGAGASALSSAKTYAEQKAEAARVAAEQAAAADATAKAEAAEAAAAATAAADATAKANAAELAAKSAAAADATAKANQAETNAKNAAQAWVDAAKATALKSVVIEYAVGSSETVAPTTGWSTATPTRTPGTFIWYRSIATRGDDTSTTSSPALLTGNAGAQGPQGPAGSSGRGVAGTTVTYAKSASGTAAPAAGSFGASIPATTTGEFLWTRTVTTYTDGLNPTTAYSVSAHGATGATGGTGPAGRGVSGTTVEYAKAATGTAAPGSGWTSTVPSTVAGEFLWTRTTTTYTSGSPTVAYSVAAHGSTGPAGPGGEDGTDGVGITGTTVTYQTGTSGTTAPTGTWQSSPTTTSPGQYLWTKTVTTLSDATSATAYAVAAHGATGPQGSTGADGIGITGTTVTYQKSSSGTTAPTGAWVSSPVATTAGEFLWTRTVTSYSSGSPTTAYSVAAHGSQGPKGDTGAAAPLVYLTTTAQALVSPAAGGATTPATATVTGTAVNTTITAWTYSVDGAAFTATVPAGVSRSGNTVTITGSTMTAKTITVRMADAAGVADTATVAKVSDGAAGTPGTPGADAYTVVLSNEAHTFAGSTAAALAGSTTSTVIAYKGATQMAATVGTITGQVTGLTTSIANNGGTAPVITITATTALTTRNGTLTVPVTVDGKVFTKTIAWAVSYTGATGATGGTGATGVSVSSVTPYFRTVATGTAAPAAPTGATPAAPWQATEPAYAANLDLYRSDRIVFSNGTTTYTPVTLVSSYTAAKAAETNAKAFATTQVNGVSKSYWSTALPGTTQAAKDSTWYRHDASGKIIAVFNQTATGTGASWTARPITSEAIDSLDVGKLTVGGTSTLQQAVINQMAVQLANIITARIENLTVTETSQLNTVVAQRIAANVGEFVQIFAQQITGGQITAAIGIGTNGKIVAGDPAGARVEIADDGVRVYVIGPNGSPYETVSMVNGRVAIRVMGQDGTILGGITDDGSISGTRGSFTKDLMVRGRPMIGKAAGSVIPGWLDNLPRGIVPGAFLEVGEGSRSGQKQTGIEYPSLSVSAYLEPDRRYRVVFQSRFRANVVGGLVLVRLRYAKGSSMPTTASPLIGRTTYATWTHYAAQIPNLEAEAIYTPTSGIRERVTFRMTFEGAYGALPERFGGTMYIEDVGPIAASGSGGDDDTSGTVLYESTWKATASREYDYNGNTLRNDGDMDIWYWAETRESVAWIYGGGAVEASHPTEFGKTLPQALTGATLHKVEIYVHNKLWWEASRTSAPIVVNTLASATLPTTKLVEGALWGPEIPQGQGVWFEVPTTWFTNGANLGITMGDRDVTFLSEWVRSGVFHGVSGQNPPMLRATYSR